jgi:hypothetical protein
MELPPSCLRLRRLSTKLTTATQTNRRQHEETVITAIIQVFGFWDLAPVRPKSAVSGRWLVPLLLVEPAPMDGSGKLGGDDGSPINGNSTC